MNRREFLLGSSALGMSAVAAEKTTDGGLSPVFWAERERREVAVLPAGAGNAQRFATRCLGCHLCVAVCPSKCLRPSTSLSRLGKVELDFRHGWCKPDCTRCGEVCPVNAIESLTVMAKRMVHVGRAVWRKDLCLRTTEGDECHACEKHCPVKAVKLIGGFPVVDAAICVGCGACEHYCPAHLSEHNPTHQSAIRVEGYAQHQEYRPMDERDLIAEMRALAESGKTFIVAQRGVIVFSSEAHMIEPFAEAEKAEAGMLRGALVYDKVVGKAAAKKHIAAGVRKVITPVIAKKAKRMLEAAGVEVEAGEIVEKILNRDRTGECPLDAKF